MEKNIVTDQSQNLSRSFSSPIQKHEEKIHKINSDFDGVSRRLFDILSSLRQTQGTRHTAQLVMRIDYNKYYSLNKSNMKSVAPFEKE